MRRRRDPNEPRLIAVPHVAQAAEILWKLLEERPPEANISHREMPTWAEHCSFVERYPYRCWYLIKAPTGDFVGAVYLSRHWEIGIGILREHQRKGYAKWALREMIWKWGRPKAIRGVPGVRRQALLANIAPGNEASKRLFEAVGFKFVQETYALDIADE